MIVKFIIPHFRIQIVELITMHALTNGERRLTRVRLSPEIFPLIFILTWQVNLQLKSFPNIMQFNVHKKIW